MSGNRPFKFQLSPKKSRRGIPIQSVASEDVAAIASLALDQVKNLTQELAAKDRMVECSKRLMAGPNSRFLAQQCKELQGTVESTRNRPNDWSLLSIAPPNGRSVASAASLEIVESDMDEEDDSLDRFTDDAEDSAIEESEADEFDPDENEADFTPPPPNWSRNMQQVESFAARSSFPPTQIQPLRPLPSSRPYMLQVGPEAKAVNRNMGRKIQY
jgi:hypothetical protein